MTKYFLSITKIYSLKIIFALRKLNSSHGQDFYPGQNYFVLDKSDFVQDKKYFVRVDGQGISKKITIFALTPSSLVKMTSL